MVFTESSAVQDLMDFSRQVLAMEAEHRLDSGSVDISDISGATTPVRDPSEGTRVFSSNPQRTTSNTREFRKKVNRRAVPGKHSTVAKNDIRRGYAQAYIDALNSGNIPVFKKSLLDFCMPDCVLITRNISPTGMVFPSLVEVISASFYLFVCLIHFSDFGCECSHSFIRSFY